MLRKSHIPALVDVVALMTGGRADAAGTPTLSVASVARAPSRRGQRRRVRGLVCVTLLLGVSAQPASAAGDSCGSVMGYRYDTESFSAGFSIDTRGCYNESWGGIDVTVSVQRGKENPVVVREFCEAAEPCDVRASIPHLAVELATYNWYINARWDYPDVGAGGVGYAPCSSYVIRAECPPFYSLTHPPPIPLP